MKEERELEAATFTPQLAERTRHIAATALPRAAGQVFEDLYSKAAERREARAQLEEEKRQQEVEGYTFKPDIHPKSQQMSRGGCVEDRLIAGWAESLLLREEEAARSFEDEERRIQLEAEALRRVGTTETLAWRRKMEEGRDPSQPPHERLYSNAAEQRSRKEAVSAQEATTPTRRWDGSLQGKGSPRVSLSSNSGRQTPRAAAAGAPAAEGAEAIHERLYRKGAQDIQQKMQREEAERSIVQRRLAGFTGDPVASPSTAVCERLYVEAQAQRERMAKRAEEGAPRPSPGKPGVHTAEATAAAGNRMYTEAMARMQQREQIILQVQMEQEAVALDRVHRTASRDPARQETSDRLYGRVSRAQSLRPPPHPRATKHLSSLQATLHNPSHPRPTLSLPRPSLPPPCPLPPYPRLTPSPPPTTPQVQSRCSRQVISTSLQVLPGAT